MHKGFIGDTAPRPKSARVLLVFSMVLILVVGAAAWWWYAKKEAATNRTTVQKTIEAEQIGPKMDSDEIDKLLKKVGKHILLPENQEPTIATIQNADALISLQPFFYGSENGDKVLLYEGRAFIYSPTKDKLINAGPIVIDNPSIPSDNE